MPNQHTTPAPIPNTGAPSQWELKEAFQSLTDSEQQEVMALILLIAQRKYQHLDQNHIPRLVNAIRINNPQHIRAELQYANEQLGTHYDLSHWEVCHD